MPIMGLGARRFVRLCAGLLSEEIVSTPSPTLCRSLARDYPIRASPNSPCFSTYLLIGSCVIFLHTGDRSTAELPRNFKPRFLKYLMYFNYPGIFYFKKNKVDSLYNTLNRLKSYLSRFWDFYKSSPRLQEILSNA